MSKKHFPKMFDVAPDEIFCRQLYKMSSRFANSIFLRRLKGILQRCFQGVFYHCLENYLAKMSKNCIFKKSYIPLYEMSFRQIYNGRILLDLQIRHLLASKRHLAEIHRVYS